MTQQYSRLKELTLDINKFLQTPENYIQFDPNIRSAIFDESKDETIPAYVKELPQVKLIRSIRHSIQIIANDFESKDYAKIPKIIYHLTNFWDVAKAYLLAEKTMSLSPEFNSKMISLIHLLVQCNQVFHEELNNISTKPKAIFKSSENEYTNNDTKKWHYYREKVSALLQVIANDNKLKPYIKNLERLIIFIIDLKEKGILKSNPITTVLDFVESFNKLSQTSLKAILQEYAILSKDEIKDLLTEVKSFWNSFLPLCDEIEINSGLATGYLTKPLAPVLNFCNMLELEFNIDNVESDYPFTTKRLSRIRHGIDETDKLLKDQTDRHQKLGEFDEFIKNFEEKKIFTPEEIIPAHQFIDLLRCDESQKQDFHQLIDLEVESLSKKLIPEQMETLEFHQLLNKYKMHEANLVEAQQLFSMLQESNIDPSAQKHYQEMSDEYSKATENFSETLQKIEKGQLKEKDIKHLFVMINAFEVLETEAGKKTELVKSVINNQIKNIEKLGELLNRFETKQLQEQDFYPLLSYIDFLDCDLSIKQKYKKQISDLDHKRKNGGYLSVFSDLVLGLFVEVLVPFSEIYTLIQDKLTSLQTLANADVKANSNPPTIKEKVEDPLLEVLNPISKQLAWTKLKNNLKTDQDENKECLVALQSIKTYQEQRYGELNNGLLSYKTPMAQFDEVEEGDRSREPFSLKKYISNFIKSAITEGSLYLSSFYSTTKSAFSRFKSFLFQKKSNPETDNLQIVRKEINPETKPQLQEPVEASPYKQLSFIEDKLSWFLEKSIDPIFFAKLKSALTSHQSMSLTKDMPYFYRQGAELVNTFILFRKVLLSYSHLDMLQLTIAVSNLNTENKKVLDTILKDSTLAKSSSFYEQILKPTLANTYQTVANLKTEDNFSTSFPQVAHTIHNGIKLIAQNKQLNFEPFLNFLKRVENNFNKPNNPQNQDLQKIYSSINKLSQFVQKVLNNQQNLLVEVLFSLSDLIHQFNQLSASITQLLIKDQFPYLKELGELMKNLQEILLLFQKNIEQFRAAGLHPTIITSLNDCVQASESVISKLTPIEFQKARILLEVEQLNSGFLKCGSDRILKNELDNIQLLLTQESDKKLVDQKVLGMIETRLHEIKSKRNDSYASGCFSFFSRHNPFANTKPTQQHTYTNNPKNRLA